MLDVSDYISIFKQTTFQVKIKLSDLHPSGDSAASEDSLGVWLEEDTVRVVSGGVSAG